MAKTIIIIIILFITIIIFIKPVIASINVTNCTVLNESDTYLLTNNITANQSTCLYLNNPNITLDCQGNIINGAGYTDLIWLNKGANVRNCVLTNYTTSGLSIYPSSAISQFNITNITFNDTNTENINGIITYAISDSTAFGGGPEYFENINHIINNDETINCYTMMTNNLIGTGNKIINNSRFVCGILANDMTGTNIYLYNVTGENNKYILAPTTENITISNMNNISQILIYHKNITLDNITFNNTNYKGISIQTIENVNNLTVKNVNIYNSVRGILGSTSTTATSYFNNIIIQNFSRYAILWNGFAYNAMFDNITATGNNISFNNPITLDTGAQQATIIIMNNSMININFSTNIINPYAILIDVFSTSPSNNVFFYNNYINIDRGGYYNFTPATGGNESNIYLNKSLTTASRIFGVGNLIGGNYYQNSTGGPSIDCVDANYNGICDSSILFTYGSYGFRDYLPLSDNYDNIKPVYYNDTYVNSIIRIGTEVNFTINLTDNYKLGNYIFSWNDSGAWVNTSWIDISSYSTTIINTLRNITATHFTNICRQYWFNDSYGNTNQTDIICFNVSNTPPIINSTFISPSPIDVFSNLTCNYTAYDADGDNITILTTNWTINNVVNETHNNTFSGGQLTSTSNISCSLMINDSWDNSTWLTSALVVLNDTLPPIINGFTYPTSTYTDTTYYINISCIDPEGSGIYTGYPKISYIDPDNIQQGNYTMSSAGSGIYYYATTLSKSGIYRDFVFNCMDSQSHLTTNITAFTINSSIRPVVTPPAGGGGVIVITTPAKVCNWSFNENELIFYSGDNAKRLILYNNENSTISPIYTISGTLFSMAGTKSIITPKSSIEMTILKTLGEVNNSEVIENLTIKSTDCLPIHVNIKFINTNSTSSLAFNDILKSAVDKLNSNIQLFGYPIKFYWITLLTIAFVILLLLKANTSPGIKVTSGIIMVLLINVLLASILTTTVGTTTESTENYIGSILSSTVINTTISGQSVSLSFYVLFAIILIILLGIMFAINKFDWWANALIALFLTIIITITLQVII